MLESQIRISRIYGIESYGLLPRSLTSLKPYLLREPPEDRPVLHILPWRDSRRRIRASFYSTELPGFFSKCRDLRDLSPVRFVNFYITIIFITEFPRDDNCLFYFTREKSSLFLMTIKKCLFYCSYCDNILSFQRQTFSL